MSEEFDTNDGVTRREALKKGARLGGALVWAIPVVQTVGMSSAMAQTVSEGTCCLRITMTEPVYNPVSERVEFSWSVQNCGSENIDDVRGIIERSRNDGASWIPTVNDDKGILNAGTPPVVTFESIGVARPATLIFRAHGTFTCLGQENIWHTIPGGGVNTYVNRGPLAVPAP